MLGKAIILLPLQEAPFLEGMILKFAMFVIFTFST